MTEITPFQQELLDAFTQSIEACGLYGINYSAMFTNNKEWQKFRELISRAVDKDSPLIVEYMKTHKETKLV